MSVRALGWRVLPQMRSSVGHPAVARRALLLEPPQSMSTTAIPKEDVEAPLKEPLGLGNRLALMAKQGVKSAVNISVLFLAALGGVELYDQYTGAAAVPVFRPMAPVHLDAFQLEGCLTQTLDAKKLTPKTAWEALQPTLSLLESVVPEVADWVKERHQAGSLHFVGAAELSDFHLAKNGAFQGMGGGYNRLTGEMKVGEEFWSMNEAEKAGFMVHEYRHSLQGVVRTFKNACWMHASGKGAEYGTDPLEVEAFLYEKAFYRTLGVAEPEEVTINLYRAALNKDDIRVMPGKPPSMSIP